MSLTEGKEETIGMSVRIKPDRPSKLIGERALIARPSGPTANSLWEPNRAYFALVERLKELRRSQPSLSVAFTSVLPGEGVTYVVDALTRELARQSGDRVVSVPVSELKKNDSLDAFLQDDASEILPELWREEGPESWNEPESTPLERHLNVLRKRFDYVLVNCPSLKQSTDALVVGKHCAGVCLVVAAGKTTRNQIQGALTTMALASVPVLGFVLNKRTYPVPEFIYKFL